ncbi:MAG: co-chaperone DjlA [Gammaproteobacteria bacterium]|nr:co-chaperone DjlA [Gammaproteobacteria bacterium]
MSWWGKVLGGTLGFTMGGPLGALLGGYLGHRFVDKNPLKGLRQQIEYTQAAFFTATFSVMGHLAKADGRVSENEIDMAKQVMDHMNLNPEQRQAAINFFNKGKSADFNLEEVLFQFQDVASRQKNLKQMFIEIQLHAVYSDGQKHPEEQKILARIADILGFTQQQLQHLEAMIQANIHGGMGTEDRRPIQEQLQDAYQVLEVSESDSDQQIKRSYRKLMSQHHPDKLVSKGLPEEMMKMANEKTQQIKKAYELIKKHRG